MNKRRAVIGSAVMVLLCAAFILTVEILRKPGVESICDMLRALPEYSGSMELNTDFDGAYFNLTAMPTNKICIYQANDGTAKEFAVCKVSGSRTVSDVMTVFQHRARELLEQFADNPDEMRRIEYFRIINVDDFVTFTVYDTNGTAEKAVHNYFETH